MRITGGIFQVASDKETKAFLTAFPVEAQDAARVLWDTHSGKRGLLDSNMDGRGYYYDEKNRTYIRKTDGHKVTDEELRMSVRRVSTATRNELRKQTQQLIAGTIILAVYYSRVRSIMNALYSTIWLLSIGGFLFDDDTARNLFYLWVLHQFNYFDRFADDLDKGAASLDGRAVIRSGMYGEAGNGMWQNIVLEQKAKDGYQEARRILGDNENHCESGDVREGCLELANEGWIPIEYMIPIGDATCLSNCHCWIEYRKRR